MCVRGCRGWRGGGLSRDQRRDRCRGGRGRRHRRAPGGTYLSFSIRLKSHIALVLEPGATLLAADPADGKGSYDPPEPNEWDAYQDFGHSHWQNSLIWGIGLENVSIPGPGRSTAKG